MIETDDTFISYKHNPSDTNSLSNNLVHSILESSSGILWVGTMNGLNKFDYRNNKYYHYGEKEGMPDNVVMSILEDNQQNLWLLTFRGIARFNPSISGKDAFKNFDVGDGLHGNEFGNTACFQGKTGEIYAGGMGGLLFFTRIIFRIIHIYQKL